LLPVRAGDRNLKIVLLLGQSNMEGQAYTFTDPARNAPTLEFLLSGTTAAETYLTNMPFTFKEHLAEDWMTPRSDVWGVHYDSSDETTRGILPTQDPADEVTGIQPLSPGFGFATHNGSTFGMELSLGIRLGDALAAPVFLFKSDKGGTSLGHDWRPPDAVTVRGGTVGVHYTNTVNSLVAFLDALDADLADNGVLDAYDDAPGYEVSAVVWLQGWNEQFDDGPYTAAQLQAEYADNLKDLLTSLRSADPRIPDDLPMVILESSDQNATLNAARQSAVADLNDVIPHSAVYLATDNMIGVDWGNNDDGEPFTAAGGFHFHARAENFLEMGWLVAGAMLEEGYLTQAPTYFTTKIVEDFTYPAFIIGVTGIEVSIDDLVITVEGTEAGSPSEGLFAAGDILVSINGVTLRDGKDPRVALGSQINAAEGYDGRIVFGVLRGGTPMDVTVTVPVIGSYTGTWPLNCPKSDQIVDTVAQYILDEGMLNQVDVMDMFAGLFLLSTGEDQYLDEVEIQVDRILAGGLPGGHQSWGIGYQLLLLTEYHLRTGDDKVLTRIQQICDYAASGDIEGMYGHGLNPGSGYVQGGIMNQPGTIVSMGMTLALECGVTVDRRTWQNSVDHLFRYAGHGAVPYGDHRSERFPNSNGKEAAAGVLYSLLEGPHYEAAARYTAFSVADSYTFIESGHTGGGFDVIWRPLGAAHVSPEQIDRQRNMLDRIEWYYDLCRRHDGSFHMLPSGTATRYTGADWGIGAAMVYTASRKALRITGAPKGPHAHAYPDLPPNWGNDRDREVFSDQHVADYGADDLRADAIWQKLHNPDEVSAAALGRILYHANAGMRELAAIRLGERADEASLTELKTALAHSDPRPRRAALEAIVGYEGFFRPMNQTSITREQITEHFLPLIQAVIDDPASSLWEIDGALLALGKAEAEDIRDNLPFIVPYLEHPDWWLREAAVWAIAGLGEAITPEEFQMILQTYQRETRVFASHSYDAAIEEVLKSNPPLLTEAARVVSIQTLGRSLHQPAYIDAYRDGEYNKIHRTLMIFEHFDRTELPGDIPDDIARYFNRWDSTNVPGIQQVQSDPQYHRGFYGYANGAGADGAYIIHAMKRNRDQVLAEINGGNTDTTLQNYYDAVAESVSRYETDFGEVTPYPGQPGSAVAATAVITGGSGDMAELSLDGSSSSDPDGTLLDYVWEANGVFVARGAVTTGFAAIGDLDQLTLRITDDQAYQTEIPVAVQGSPLALTYGLVGYWPMDNVTGTELTDVSGFGNHGAFVEGAPAWVAGKFGNALEVSRARDDRAAIPHLDRYTDTQAYTVSFWFRSEDGEGKLNQFSKGEGLIAVSGEGSDATMDQFGTPWTAADLGFDMDDGIWHHLVFTFDAAATPAKHLVVNGVLVATGTTSTGDMALNNSPFQFNSSDDAEKATARFDEVAVWDRVLTSTELSHLYNNGTGAIVSTNSLAPSRPTGVTALAGNGDVTLSWEANTDAPDLAGYRVYRSTSEGGPYTLASGDLVTTEFTDTAVVNYTRYYYVVRTVNTRGAESINSREVDATPFVPMKTVLANGLVGYWPMDSVRGTEIVDVTANQNDGTFLQGSPDWVGGKFGNALDIVKERDDWAEIPHLNDYIAAESYSIAFWIYPVDVYRSSNVFSKGLNKVGLATNNWEVSWGYFGSPWTETEIGFRSNDRTWRHVVILYDPAATPAKSVFVDGVLAASNDTVGVATDTALNADPIRFNIAGPNQTGSARFDDLAIWNRALTQEEINYLYNTGDGNTVSDLNEVPDAPSGVTATATDETVVLTWEQGTQDTEMFTVFRSTTPGGPYDTIGTLTETRFVDSGLTNGTDYFYVIKAVDLNGAGSPLSAEVTATPGPDADAPISPSGLTAVNGYTRVYLQWSANPEPDVASYNVYRSTEPGGPFALLSTAGRNPEFVDQSLTNGVTYYYRVSALDLAGNESDPADITASPFALQDVTTGLVGYWPLDAAVGTGIEDRTVQENDGVITAGTPDWVLGKFGNALQFVEAEQEEVQIPEIPAYTQMGAYTIAFWVYQQDGYRNMFFSAHSSNRIRFYDFRMSNFGDLWPSLDLGFANDETWHHIAITLDTSDPVAGKNVYLDGVRIASAPAYATDSALDLDFLRLSCNHSGFKWGGRIDDLAVWDRALSLDEIESLVLTNGGAGRAVLGDVQTPPIADHQDVITDEDVALGITLTGNDGQEDTLTYLVVDNPTNGVLSGTAPNLTYTPDAEFHGTDSFTFKIHDGTEEGNTATVSITVNSVNDVPVADAQNLNTDEDTPLAITLTASDLDLDDLTFTVQDDPAYGQLTGTGPNRIYTPDAHYNGPDSFTFFVNDGTVDSPVVTVSLTVNPVNDVPVAQAVDVQVLEDSEAPARLGGTDADGDALSYSIQTPPANGELTGTAPDLTYTPDPGYSGPDSFVYVVNDGTVDSNPVTATITVTDLDHVRDLLAQGLVGYWPMDNTTGTELTDEGPNLNHGSFVEGTPQWIAGKFGNAIDLKNYRDDRAAIPHIPQMNETGAFTMSFWINPIDCWRDNDVFSKGVGRISLHASNRDMTWAKFGTPWTSTDLGFDGADAVWVHVGIIYEPAAALAKRVYLNGVLTASDTVETGDLTHILNELEISFSSPADNYKTIAQFDDTAYWNRALTPGELSFLYNGGTGNTVMDLTDPPAAPVNLRADPTTESILLSWEHPDDDVVSTAIYRRSDVNDPYILIDTTPESSYTDNGLSNGITYEYVFRSIDVNGNESTESLTVSATPESDTLPPVMPQDLAAEGGYTRIHLSWTASPEPDLAGYTVSRSISPGGPFIELATGLTEPAYTDGGRTNGTPYYYQVTAEDLAGNSSPASSVSGTPQEFQDVATGLVGYWPLDETEGTSLPDATGSGYDGAFTSGTPDWLAGKFGMGLNFVEPDQESAQINDLPDFGSTGAYSLSVWVKQVNGYRNLFLSSQQIGFRDYKLYSFGSAWTQTDLGFFDDDTWHHVLLTFDISDPVGGKKLYVDGVLLSEQPAYVSDTTLDDTFLRLSSDHVGYRWGGMLDDLAFWNRALTQDQVESLVLSNGGAGRPVSQAAAGFDLSVEVSPSTDNLWNGTRLVYILTVTNTGTESAPDVQVTNTLPSLVSFDSATPSADISVPPVYTFDLGEVPSNTVTQIEIQVDSTATVPVVLTNQVQVTSSAPEVILSNNTATATTIVADYDLDGLVNPLDPDDDNDGVLDVDEIDSDTNPLDGGSRLKLTGMSLTNGKMTLHWTGGEGVTQYLERTTDLTEPTSWQVIHTITPPTPLSNTQEDPTTLALPTFYRIRTGPAK